MKATRIAIGMDKVVVRFSNTFLSIDRGIEVLFNIFGYHIEDLQFFSTPSLKCYFSKEHGTDFKVSLDSIVIEFHGTFCSIHGWEKFKILKNKIQESFNTYARITEIHVAQDFTELALTHFFKHPHLVFRFKSRKNEIEDPQSGEVQTIYLRSTDFRWNLTIYDKTAEIKKNISKSTPSKIEHYRKRGYLSSKITRVELKLHSDYCKKFIETFESSLSETKICEAILNFWFRKHKIYSLKKSQVFDQKHPDRHQVWPLWKQLFSKKQKLIDCKLPEDALFKKLHTTDIDKISEKITNNSLRYNEEPEELIASIYKNRKKLIEKAEEVKDRRRRTDEYLQSLIKTAA